MKAGGTPADDARLACQVVVEYVDHPHEHVEDPVRMREGRSLAPEQPGYSGAMLPESVEEHAFPDGAVWRAAA